MLRDLTGYRGLEEAPDFLTVSCHRHSTAELPCQLNFTLQEARLIVVWVMEKDGEELVVHRFSNGQDDFSQQAQWYSGRTAMPWTSHGTLTLSNVDADDQGIYECRYDDHDKHYGSNIVKLSLTEPERSLWMRGILIAVVVGVTLLFGALNYIIYKKHLLKMANEDAKKPTTTNGFHPVLCNGYIPTSQNDSVQKTESMALPL
ncbi:myelin-oligodendrocyte glycoprotein-like isoform X1 [Hyperolius riggenbachi]|uniref:myelin-oligodendrocyte glycoprotein-like isoform X1 n=1 Tax=Hyperolius riggenbachi TaxID=752182 RepID=UPI0035A2C5FD